MAPQPFKKEFISTGVYFGDRELPRLNLDEIDILTGCIWLPATKLVSGREFVPLSSFLDQLPQQTRPRSVKKEDARQPHRNGVGVKIRSQQDELGAGLLLQLSFQRKVWGNRLDRVRTALVGNRHDRF